MRSFPSQGTITSSAESQVTSPWVTNRCPGVPAMFSL
jgi:hypothetical protein